MKVSELIAKLKECDGFKSVVISPPRSKHVYVIEELKDTKQFVVIETEL